MNKIAQQHREMLQLVAKLVKWKTFKDSQCLQMMLSNSLVHTFGKLRDVKFSSIKRYISSQLMKERKRSLTQVAQWQRDNNQKLESSMKQPITVLTPTLTNT